MTATVPLQIKQGLVSLMAAIPGVATVHLDRASTSPIGKNEVQGGPVIDVSEDSCQSTGADSQVTLPLVMQLRIGMYFPVGPGTEPLDEQSDGLWQAINSIMYGDARRLPGVTGVEFKARVPTPDGFAGRVDLVWLVRIRVHQLDLTQLLPS